MVVPPGFKMINLSSIPSLFGEKPPAITKSILGIATLLARPVPLTLPPDYTVSIDCLNTLPHLVVAVTSAILFTSPT